MRDPFCIPCGSMCCAHVAETSLCFTPREISILRLMLDPNLPNSKQLSHALGIGEGTFKVYLSRIYAKLGWSTGCMRVLTIWVVAHAANLGVALPTPESFR